ncbi:MAG: hypothetical protein Q4D86_00055 [Pasteurella oralis]|uniref:hypothetical protein n=1 Tax=Pasteurella oralis TaxID=1071947 RepID=UPI0027011FCA|nr:hypothetical protein [Pasteurella oralis]
MSIRTKKFSENITPLWSEIYETIINIETKGLSSDNIDEIAQLKKVATYFNEMIETVDPDFVPIRTIENVRSPLNNIKSYLQSYNSNGNISYLKEINEDYLDTLLRDLMPFVFYKGRAGKALRLAINEYSQTISEKSKNYLSEIEDTVEKTKEVENKARKILEELYSEQEQVISYSKSLFDEEGIQERISEFVSSFEDKNVDITDFHIKIFSSENGIKKKILSYLNDSENDNKEIKSLKENSSDILDDLEIFHTEIFGERNEDGELEGGLKEEIIIRRKELEEFKIQQQDRYRELNNQIESLLPGATSAGLSSSYNKMHTQFKKSVKNYGYLFYISLVLLLGVVIGATFIDKPKDYYLATAYSIVAKPNNTDMIKNDLNKEQNNSQDNEIHQINMKNEKPISYNLVYMLNNIIYKLPFILPALWLVLFISRRRNEAQRLEQEYAHKEALAKSYESYKQQIEKLDEKDRNELLPILMKNMLEAISLNPAKTLDKDNKDPTPIEEIVKRKEFWEYIERIKSLVTPSKDK